MRRARWAEALIYLPLLIPQISFLFGMNVLLLRLGLSGALRRLSGRKACSSFPM